MGKDRLGDNPSIQTRLARTPLPKVWKVPKNKHFNERVGNVAEKLEDLAKLTPIFAAFAGALKEAIEGFSSSAKQLSETVTPMLEQWKLDNDGAVEGIEWYRGVDGGDPWGDSDRDEKWDDRDPQGDHSAVPEKVTQEDM